MRHIFVTFAIQDATYRDLLVTRARKDKLRCTFVELTLKAPGDAKWQSHCRSKISGCDAVIALLSENTAAAAGVLSEVKCAREIGLPILGVRLDLAPQDAPARAAELEGLVTLPWKWETIASFLETTFINRDGPGPGDESVERATRLAG